MAAALPTVNQCADACDDAITTAVAGPAGADGEDGVNGTDGVNAYSTLDAQFTMPALGASSNATVSNNSWMAYGQIVAIGDPAGAAPYAYMQVGAKVGTTTVALTNLESAGGAYADNVAAGTVFPIGTIVSPGGLQGPTGETGSSGAPADATFWVSSPDGDLSAEVDMSALAAGYLKVNAGTPSTVTVVPIADIDTGAATTAQVLKPDGAGGVVAGQVEDDEIEYAVEAIAALDIDWSAGRVFTKTLPAGPGTTTFTMSNHVTGKAITVILTQDGTTARDVAWPTGIFWEGGVAPAMSSTLSCKAVFSFVYDGAITIGTVVNNTIQTT